MSFCNWMRVEATTRISFALFRRLRIAAPALCVLVASNAFAQSTNQVSLRFNDEGESITGELLEYTNGNFRIQSSIGSVTIPGDDVSCIGDACPAGTKAETTGPLLKLTSPDGSITVSGNLIEIKDESYILATSFGELAVEFGSVICEGDGCIEEVDTPADTTVVLRSGATEIHGELLGFDDDSYLIQSDIHGEVRIKRNAFSCEGEACP